MLSVAIYYIEPTHNWRYCCYHLSKKECVCPAQKLAMRTAKPLIKIWGHVLADTHTSTPTHTHTHAHPHAHTPTHLPTHQKSRESQSLEFEMGQQQQTPGPPPEPLSPGPGVHSWGGGGWTDWKIWGLAPEKRLQISV